jgi:hypothetical protein
LFFFFFFFCLVFVKFDNVFYKFMKADIDVSSEKKFIPHLLTMLFRRITLHD